MIVLDNTIVWRVALLKQNCYNKMKINRYFFPRFFEAISPQLIANFEKKKTEQILQRYSFTLGFLLSKSCMQT
mgnify:CR=1 FL=1